MTHPKTTADKDLASIARDLTEALRTQYPDLTGATVADIDAAPAASYLAVVDCPTLGSEHWALITWVGGEATIRHRSRTLDGARRGAASMLRTAVSVSASTYWTSQSHVAPYPTRPATPVGVLRCAADLIEQQGHIRRVEWTPDGITGRLGAETAICVASTGTLTQRTVAGTDALIAMDLHLGDLTHWANGLSVEDAHEIPAAMRHVATCLVEEAVQTAEEKARELEAAAAQAAAEGRMVWAGLLRRRAARHAQGAAHAAVSGVSL